MSILIKGIDLPKGARYADISFLDKFGMPVGDEYIEEAIQIDRPHGRLIDGDKLSIEFENQCAGECADCLFEERCVIIDRIAPTILEAEE